MVMLIASDADPEYSPAILDLEDNELESPGSLHETFPPDMHPFDVVQMDNPLASSRMKNDMVILEDQLPVTHAIQHQSDERNEKEQDHDVHNRITVNQSELIFYKTAPDSRVQKEGDEINQRLLIVEIELVSKDSSHGL